jgi:hypothetical protein
VGVFLIKNVLGAIEIHTPLTYNSSMMEIDFNIGNKKKEAV